MGGVTERAPGGQRGWDRVENREGTEGAPSWERGGTGGGTGQLWEWVVGAPGRGVRCARGLHGWK